MRKINIIISTVLLIFVNGCAGYEPIFSSKNINFVIEDHLIEGDKVLGNKIYSKLYNLSKSQKNNPDARTITILINVLKNKNATSKDSSGKILEYKIELDASIKINDFLTNDIILHQTFSSSTNYKVQDQYFETIKLENTSVENLINNMYQDLLITLSQNV